MKKTLVLLVALLLSASATAGERLEYNLQVMGADYGTATMQIDGQKVFATMKANQKWASIYNVDNSIASVLRSSGVPKRTEYAYKVADKEGRRDIFFGARNIRVKGKKVRNHKTSKPTHDPISWMLRVRQKLSEGKGTTTLTFKVFSGARFYNVSCYPLPVQSINTALGEKLTQPYHVKVTRRGGDFKREMTMWFNLESKTNSFEPLRVTGKFKLGSAEANLVSVKTREGDK